MSSFVLWVLILSIWNVVLFYSHPVGLSALLFIVPLLIYYYFLLRKSKKIKNKKGLLYIIPIVLLSATYLIFANGDFPFTNAIAIVLLFSLLFNFTINPTYKLSELFDNVMSVIFEPLGNIGKFFRLSTSKIGSKIKLNDKKKKVLKSLLIVLPIVLIVIALLSSADMIFGELFKNMWNTFTDFIESNIFSNLFGRLILFIFIFFAIGCSSLYLMFDFPKKKKDVVVKEESKDLYTLKLLFIILNIIYIIFDFIQIRSLLLHRVATGFNYATYARQGFFELMVVSVINIGIILISKKYESKENKKEFKLIKVMSIVMVLLTIVIIVSSFYRMNLYEAAYGYTTLRLIVYITLITETILMIPTAMYIFNSNFNIVGSYLVIVLIAYLVANYINMDYLIARRNVDRYYVTNKLDLEYLENYHSDNIPVLVELYNKTDNQYIKQSLSNYFRDRMDDFKMDNIIEYNFAKDKANKLLKGVELLEDKRNDINYIMELDERLFEIK